MAAQDPRRVLLAGHDAMEEDEDIDMPVRPMAGAAAGDSAPVGAAVENKELISTIITPSPFAHHMTGPTSSRFRNALSRVQEHPTTDTEAWQALMTEVGACVRGIISDPLQLHSQSIESQMKLDWMESCFGNLLQYFPYSVTYNAGALELLLAQSARVGEDNGPMMDYGHREVSLRSRTCQAKVEHLLERILGIHMDGSPMDPEDASRGICSLFPEIWLLYIRTRVRDAQRQAALRPPAEGAELVREWTVKAYEVAIEHAGFALNNHMLWKPYVSYIRGWVPPALPGAPPPDHALQQKQMLQLRSVYQRLATHPMTGLDQLWQEYEVFERSQNETLAQALLQEFTPKYTHARSVYLERSRLYQIPELQLDRLATTPAEDSDDDYLSKVQEEISLLKVWKKRIAYERTNPGRVTPKELGLRVRQTFKEMACVLTRHPEVWHMWSMWELHSGGGEGKENERAEKALQVLRLALKQIPDCTILAHTQTQIVELYTDAPSKCLEAMEAFLENAPNTLAFVLYQQMVRRYKGVEAARLVFSKARRTLHASEDPTAETQDSTAAAEGVVDGGNETTAKGMNGKKNRWVVTNCLDPKIGAALETKPTPNNQESGRAHPNAGPITWHLYAAHATLEHRLNHQPNVAARIYELGLRKHGSFLTKPTYVLQYAQLLLELQDTVNLRALLTRAVTACEASSDSGDDTAALWDMNLRFETLLSAADPNNVSAVANVERRRRFALMGPEVEDVATGGFVGAVDQATVGSQKTTLSEHLVRLDGYEINSSIVNGMGRMLDALDVVGLWGDGGGGDWSLIRKSKSSSMKKDDVPGGKSDACYQRRLSFENMSAMGASPESAAGADGASKLLSARDRMQQGPAIQTNTAMTMAIQQMPEWLRPMLLLLPLSRSRLPVVTKPPPHLIEMALASLTNNDLPAERPADETNSALSRTKRKRNEDDSSDEEDNGVRGSSGYSNQFRARQRARQMVNGV